MLNFDEERFLRIQSGAVALADDLHRTIAECLNKGARNLFFAGSGGAGILMLPAARLLQTRSTFPVYVEMPAELVVTGSPHLGRDSIVVIPSLSGTTKESIEALAYCQERGATVITLTGHADSPLAERADHTFTNFAEDDTSCESFYLQSLIIALAVMGERGEIDDYAEVVGELKRLPELLLEVKRGFEERAERFAAQIQDEPYHIITGSGATWPEAFYYGMCILEEMQWIRTRPVHASDFFHGTLELVEQGVSVIVFKGEDETRPLAERVEAFVPQYTDKLSVFDTAEFALPGISPRVRALISPVILATIFERVSAHLEVKRDHPLTTRRYYRRVSY
ncbi:SIS domain-containing protein [Actinoallomurus soli]|uniref:SIS domain-containing protein n=1 Tax=Actinoallomurus soli TaxID=2952535 RepID=UPI002093B5EF|nr:SIS domain-containing protein [Actinoallomurus soli]MCO5970258.1 SIS domain-containing protein [Actinoallomurus soli]